LLTQIVEYVDGVDTKFDNKVKTLDNKINTNVSNLETEKQDVLISGTSIKTINGVSILGSGDIEIKSESGEITSETDPIFTASAAASITGADITNWNNKVDESSLATVATSGSYNDLKDKPEIVINGYDDGVYAVKSDGTLVGYDEADSSCIGVALLYEDQSFMIAKQNASYNGVLTFKWGTDNLDLSLPNYAQASALISTGYLPEEDGTYNGT
jgi:hypothetical protein